MEGIDLKLLYHLFPSELMEYFVITSFQTLCNVEAKQEYLLIEFEEKNELPNGYSSVEYESKGFLESKHIQDFPLRGKAVFLKIKKTQLSTKKI
mgnify:FL=1